MEDRCRLCSGSDPHVEGSCYCCDNMPDQYTLACRVAELEDIVADRTKDVAHLTARAEKAEAERDGLERRLGTLSALAWSVIADREAGEDVNIDPKWVIGVIDSNQALAGVEVLAVVDGHGFVDGRWSDPWGEGLYSEDLRLPVTSEAYCRTTPVRVTVTRRKEG